MNNAARPSARHRSLANPWLPLLLSALALLSGCDFIADLTGEAKPEARPPYQPLTHPRNPPSGEAKPEATPPIEARDASKAGAEECAEIKAAREEALTALALAKDELARARDGRDRQCEGLREENASLMQQVSTLRDQVKAQENKLKAQADLMKGQLQQMKAQTDELTQLKGQVDTLQGQIAQSQPTNPPQTREDTQPKPGDDLTPQPGVADKAPPPPSDERDKNPILKSPEDILALAKKYGWAELKRGAGNKPTIMAWMDDIRYQINFDHCAEHCGKMTFITFWNAKNLSYQRVMTANENVAQGKATINAFGDLILEMPVNLHDGLSKNNLEVTFKWWRDALSYYKTLLFNQE